MRIVGGEFRGRSLAAPKSNTIRPTIDRTRESLFNILSHAYPESLEGTRILDVFAGTGAVGLEALSRGCRVALFVENGVEGRGLLWENIDALGLHGRARILRRDATKLGSVNNIEPFDVLFADPPYGFGHGEKSMLAAHLGGWLVPGALAILEERADVLVTVDPAFKLLESRTFGDSVMHFYRYEPEASV
ncbi:16S rRNA (guanine966-N2)-methyltransferase [Rhizobium skierniewicense]|uniref:16S rRNA (Guanine966-N2)-methyltransferase n=1 Tax=Rhizobium skierniewicense TaxID=984260 RepID=A0A7W6C382_9HYPH|nr:16S rRNA (guanine(966)-N(2))-methyltransferase RsmD [Rhizobium skierniewicense]MBB3944918.1 16S rRNA (guanine966-N2)-methyltransferase [Rhizobium skierniewicense]